MMKMQQLNAESNCHFVVDVAPFDRFVGTKCRNQLNQCIYAKRSDGCLVPDTLTTSVAHQRAGVVLHTQSTNARALRHHIMKHQINELYATSLKITL